MKRLMFTVMAVGLLMACGGGSTDTMRRLQQAEDVVEEHPDSAAGLLSQVVTTGMTEEETALYGLLWTMAEYKKANYSINDSLISRSIDYYDRHGDKWHRAFAYYYRGGVKRHMMKNVPEAIKDYKTAEGLAEGLDDWQLKSKIDEQLAFTNYFSQNVVLTLGAVFCGAVGESHGLARYGYELCVLAILVPFAFLAWRRVAFWINYFYRIFAKKRHRSILLGGGEDSLQPWFDSHNVIPGMEILGCVSGTPAMVTEQNRLHLLGSLGDMESICNRTGCRELLVVSNFSGSREIFDQSWLEKLGMKVFLLIGKPQNGDFALINLKNLH